MKKPSPASAVCTTQRAATLLGISVSSVQRLVEGGVLGAWKTRGGHRRLPLAEVLAYKTRPGSPLQVSAAPEQLRVLMVEAQNLAREQFRRRFSQWHLPATLEMCASIYQALLVLGRQQPDVLVLDLEQNHINGSVLLNTLVGDPKLWPLHVVILSEQDAATLVARGLLPEGTVFFGRTVRPADLRDYLQMRCSLHRHSAAPLPYPTGLDAVAEAAA